MFINKKMKLKYHLLKFVVVAGLFLFNASSILGQCAMCRATAESARDGYGNQVSGGINTGIVYMMGAPYILLAILGWVFYKDRIKAFLKDFRDIHA